MHDSDPPTEQQVDTMNEDSFPASDPPSTTPPGGTRKSKEMAEAHAHGHAEDAPKGVPDSDRHASETAAARQDGAHPAESQDQSKPRQSKPDENNPDQNAG